MSHPNRARIDGLRAMADWLEANPQAGIGKHSEQALSLFPNTAEEFAALVRWLGQPVEVSNETWTYCKKDFGGNTAIHICMETSKVCDLKMVQKVVEEEEWQLRPEVQTLIIHGDPFRDGTPTPLMRTR